MTISSNRLWEYIDRFDSSVSTRPNVESVLVCQLSTVSTATRVYLAVDIIYRPTVFLLPPPALVTDKMVQFRAALLFNSANI